MPSVPDESRMHSIATKRVARAESVETGCLKGVNSEKDPT